MMRCAHCARLVDTDDEPDAFVEDGRRLCEACRAELELEQIIEDEDENP